MTSGEAEDYELTWICDGKSTNESLVKEAEDCGVGSNGKSEREQGNDGESRIATKTAQAIAKIAKQRFEQPRWTFLAAIVAGAFAASKCDSGLPACFGGGEPSGDVRFRLPIDMELQFLIDFAARFSSNQKAKARQEFSKHRDAPTRPAPVQD
jgi:hypothetical protein